MFKAALTIAAFAGLTACSGTGSESFSDVPLRQMNSTEKSKISTVSESLAAATQAAGTELAGATLGGASLSDSASER